jgi:hypothetical protein
MFPGAPGFYRGRLPVPVRKILTVAEQIHQNPALVAGVIEIEGMSAPDPARSVFINAGTTTI